THPAAGNLGGGGFLLVRMADGHSTFFDFRERAPGQASRNMYLDSAGKVTNDSQAGWRASGVPGTVRGLEVAHQKFGKSKWRDLVAPAVKLAAAGFPVMYGLAHSLQSTGRLARFPESKRIFTGLAVGATLRQPELAATLDRIARRGAADFYAGETAQRLAKAMSDNGGLITLADLKDYQVREREPLTGSYRGYTVITAPPPSSGGIGILQMLGMLEGSGYAKEGEGAASTIHYVAEAMRRFYADRSKHMGDPDFFQFPVKALLDPVYIQKQRASIDREKASSSQTIGPGVFDGKESSETTHFSIVDAEGNAVSLTYTLNGSYGSGVTVPGLGFLMNNEMDDFAAKPGEPNMFRLVQGEANAIAPGKRPLSSMTPTILLKDGKLFMVLGGPGGGRIPSSALQTILNVVDFGLNVQDAVDRPRFHHQWLPDVISLEHGFSPDTIRLLEKRGHKIEITEPQSQIEAIAARAGWLEGGADGRSNSKAEGY
ncbi:MAG TPA: gamma-glutamyltransferase, partial [Bryobacteraceae bacterium]|nr:gamma-glutamyltransferase [Bryobacteraceae bacterium]